MGIDRFTPCVGWSGPESQTVFAGTKQTPDGYFVRHSDHAVAIAEKDAELARLRARVAELEAAQAWRSMDGKHECWVIYNPEQGGLWSVPGFFKSEGYASRFLSIFLAVSTHPDPGCRVVHLVEPPK